VATHDRASAPPRACRQRERATLEDAVDRVTVGDASLEAEEMAIFE
jgi:hypothetical protein